MNGVMKYLIYFIAIGLLTVSCNDEAGPIASDSDISNSLSKVTVTEYSYPLVLDGYEIEDCVTGETMTQYGTVMVYITEKTNPSGHTSLSGYTDYTYSPITLVGATSGTYTLTNGINHFGEVYKDFNYWPDFFIQHYQWHEFYENSNGDKLRFFVEGVIKLFPDGTLELENYNAKCF